MNTIVEKMVRAAKLDVALYEEAAADESGLNQSMGVVLLASLAAGIGSSGVLGPLGLVSGAVSALVTWFIWAVLTHFVGTGLLAEPQTRATLQQVMRVTGFAAAPGAIRVLGIIPFLGVLVNLVALLWTLAAFIVAIRVVLNFSSTGRAVAVAVAGFAVQLIITFFLALIGIGGLTLLAAR